MWNNALQDIDPLSMWQTSLAHQHPADRCVINLGQGQAGA